MNEDLCRRLTEAHCIIAKLGQGTSPDDLKAMLNATIAICEAVEVLRAERAPLVALPVNPEADALIDDLIERLKDEEPADFL